ncbi:hypothetical protein [Cupriavidus pampae]|uniref:Lipoprotein n=1 Tax=Cupriavidus pampae TaxID=659251 RepID=A0ABM8Y1W0_9BURK|nr:hypothetical protein [Cupriavidus pampae]CAG9186726.1 hypothetical protein LMG32289_06586 [Cupriavidus pampae]
MFVRLSLKTLLASLFVTAVLAACGGDDSAPTAPAAPNQPNQPAQPAATKSCAPD